MSETGRKAIGSGDGGSGIPGSGSSGISEGAVPDAGMPDAGESAEFGIGMQPDIPQGEDAPVRRKILDDLFDAYTILSGGNYVSLYDIKGRMTRFTPAAVELLGLPGEYIPDGAYNWLYYVHPEDRKRYEDVMGNLLRSETKHYNLTYRCRLRDGSYAMFRFIGSVIRDNEGKPELAGGIFINEGLMENTDPLTLLRSQYGFFRDVSVMMEMKRQGTALLIGLSKMTDLNDIHGYGYGNHVLQQTAWILQESVGHEGTVYRMDGAKFAVLTDHASEERMGEIYERLRHRLLGGVEVDGLRQHLQSSGGMIAIDGSVVSERTLYVCMEAAYHESKRRRQGKLVSFNGASGIRSRESLELIDTIRHAILRDCEGFSPNYQPVLDSGTGKVLGVEMLLRWRSDRYGSIDPQEYVPVLERDYVFEELGYWALRQAMLDGMGFLAQDPDLLVGVNIAPVQLEDEFFLQELREISKDTGFPLQNLCLELTQGCRLLEAGFLKKVIATLRAEGIRFVLDDFGTGLSSIDFLRDLSMEFVKFDRKYVDHVAEREEDQQVIKHLAELASACGSAVIVKCVETEAIRDIVSAYAVQGLQGDFYSAPVPAAKFLQDWMK